jgi:uncharacterized protein
MRWKGRRQSSNVQDVRGRGGVGGGFGRGGTPMRIPVGRAGGGLSIGTIIILVVIFFALRACGIDPLAMLEEGQPGGGQFTQQEGAPASDEMRQFVAVVLAETEDTWNGIFQAQGLNYREPTLTMFSGRVNSACGFASSQ